MRCTITINLSNSLFDVMGIIEVICLLVGAVATILGGVWFIIQRSFKSGVNTNRLEEIDRRTCNAQCDLHKNDIDSLKEDLKDIKNDIIAIKSLLDHPHIYQE